MAEQVVFESQDEVPPDVRALIARLMPLLLEGEHPTLATLREQYACARISRLEWTGVGFFASFDVPQDVPLAEPARITGGNVVIDLDGMPDGGACLLFVDEGKLALLEGYCFYDAWPIGTAVLGVHHPTPLLS